MSSAASIILIILVVVAALLGLMYWFSNRMQRKQLEQQKFVDANSMVVSLLIIDKKKMKLKDAPLPKNALDSAPWYSKLMSACIVKGKIGPKIVTLMAENSVFNQLPDKGGSCKVKISGLYISSIVTGAVYDEKELAKRKKAKEKAARKAEKEAAKSGSRS